MKVIFHLLDSAGVNAWILYKTVQREKGQWNIAAQQRHTLAWFKECVVLFLCGSYTSRNFTPSESVQVQHTQSNSLEAILKHQVQPIVNIPELTDTPRQGRCCLCKETKRTACIVCLQVYCYDRGRTHLKQLLSQYYRRNTLQTVEQSISTTSSTTDSTLYMYQSIQNTDTDTEADTERILMVNHLHQWINSANYSHIHTLASSAYHKNPYNGYSQGTDTR